MSAHLNTLRALWHSKSEAQREAMYCEWRPKMSISAWADRVFGSERPDYLAALTKDRPNRFELRQLLEGMSACSQIVTVFAWGGMRICNGRSAKNYLKSFCVAVEERPATRIEWYEKLRAVDARGVGPAFYTKLIRFLRKGASDEGYIMDQWLARSANLLSGDFIQMHGCGKKYVHRKNSAYTYGRFCDVIERTAMHVDAPAGQIEEFMFASPEWRNHVKKNVHA